jgi:hypothetical protein
LCQVGQLPEIKAWEDAFHRPWLFACSHTVLPGVLDWGLRTGRPADRIYCQQKNRKKELEEEFHPAFLISSSSEAYEAYIRSYECTSCANCAKEKESKCKKLWW